MTGEAVSSRNQPVAPLLSDKGDFRMIRTSAIVALAVGAFLILPAVSLAQGNGEIIMFTLMVNGMTYPKKIISMTCSMVPIITAIIS